MLVKSGAVPPRIESIAYEYIDRTNKGAQSYISSVHSYSSGDSHVDDNIPRGHTSVGMAFTAESLGSEVFSQII